MRKSLGAIGASLLVSCMFATQAYANVIISGTRVVFPAKEGEVTVRLTNENDHPVLVESWIDRGDPHSTPDNVQVPFLIMPPLFRMEAKKDQSLRIVFTNGTLPIDHESLFWLNVLEVPPKPTDPPAQEQNLLQLALRSRLKLFYRPDSLPGNPLKAATELTWKVEGNPKGYALKAHNPTPYYITISDLSLVENGKNVLADSGMVAPFSELSLPLHADAKPAAGTVVSYSAIDDYGAAETFKSTVSP